MAVAVEFYPVSSIPARMGLKRREEVATSMQSDIHLDLKWWHQFANDSCR